MLNNSDVVDFARPLMSRLFEEGGEFHMLTACWTSNEHLRLLGLSPEM